MKVKTAELSGRALGWATAMADGWILTRPQDGQFEKDCRIVLVCDEKWGLPKDHFRPSNDWGECGLLIEKYGVTCFNPPERNKHLRRAVCNGAGFTCTNVKIAICRAVVASKLGDEVDIPDELMESK